MGTAGFAGAENPHSFTHARIRTAAGQLRPAEVAHAADTWSGVAALVATAADRFAGVARRVFTDHWEGAAAAAARRWVHDYLARLDALVTAVGAQSEAVRAASEAAARFRAAIPEVGGDSADARERQRAEEQARIDMGELYVRAYAEIARSFPELPVTDSGEVAGVGASHAEGVDAFFPGGIGVVAAGELPIAGGSSAAATDGPGTGARDGGVEDRPAPGRGGGAASPGLVTDRGVLSGGVSDRAGSPGRVWGLDAQSGAVSGQVARLGVVSDEVVQSGVGSDGVARPGVVSGPVASPDRVPDRVQTGQEPTASGSMQGGGAPAGEWADATRPTVAGTLAHQGEVVDRSPRPDRPREGALGQDAERAGPAPGAVVAAGTSAATVAGLPALPTGPTVPAVPGLPAVPNVPLVPARPAVSAMPAVAGPPAVPAMPAVPGLPAVPAMPAVPAVAGLPPVLGVPAVSAVPASSGDLANSGVPPTAPGATDAPSGAPMPVPAHPTDASDARRQNATTPPRPPAADHPLHTGVLMFPPPADQSRADRRLPDYHRTTDHGTELIGKPRKELPPALGADDAPPPPRPHRRTPPCPAPPTRTGNVGLTLPPVRRHRSHPASGSPRNRHEKELLGDPPATVPPVIGEDNAGGR